MIELLQDIATDVNEKVDTENPLRQVIVNTHSPAVVQQVPQDTLLVAEPRELICSGRRFNGVRFSCLPGTWRASKLIDKVDICKKGDLLAILSPVLPSEPSTDEDEIEGLRPLRKARISRSKRVIDREDVAPYFPGLSSIR
jgi:hypothetical protein